MVRTKLSWRLYPALNICVPQPIESSGCAMDKQNKTIAKASDETALKDSVPGDC